MMRKLASGPYLYYLPELPNPRVAEIDGGVVWFAGDDQCVRLDKCTGKFVRLIEANADAIAEVILENSLAVKAAQEPVAATDSPIVSDEDIV